MKTAVMPTTPTERPTTASMPRSSAPRMLISESALGGGPHPIGDRRQRRLNLVEREPRHHHEQQHHGRHAQRHPGQSPCASVYPATTSISG